MRWLIAFAAACMLIGALPAPASAQDVLAKARAAQTRAEALALLETHLMASPDDADARTLYGIMLSWERRYDDARRELQHVLRSAPEYTDARAGLMNVEWWTGNAKAAREHSDYILQREPGHPQARLVRQRLGSDRPWTIGAVIIADSFSDDRESWQETLLAIKRETPMGAVIARASRAGRFGLSDEQIDVEFYPVFRPGTYALIGAGVSPDHALYPSNRLSLELYQTIRNGFEVSAGYRRLAFDETVQVYAGSLSKYAGNWLIGGRVNYVDAGDGETSGHLQARRYFGVEGTSFAGVSYSRGLHRDEIRGEGELLRAGSNTVRAELNALVTPRLRVNLDAGLGRTSRAAGAFWQRTFAAGASLRF